MSRIPNRTLGPAVLLACSAPLAAQQLFGELHRMLPADTAPTHAVAVGDVDLDGDRDLFWGRDDHNALLKSDGFGGFTDASGGLPGHTEDTRAVVLGDVDGDGDLDAFVANGEPGAGSGEINRLLLGDGSGSFSDATAQLPQHVENSADAALFDADGDGDLDILVANVSQKTRLYTNDGAGLFANASSQLPGINVPAAAVVWGDVDGDGDLDVLVGTQTGSDRLLLNDGSGTFASGSSQLPPSSDQTADLALVDGDGDGDLDVLVATLGGMRYWVNDGSGVFVASPANLTGGALFDVRGVAVADLNGDGAPDAAVSLLVGVALLVNDGTGVFAKDDTSVEAREMIDLRGLVASDVDGDGDQDLLVGARNHQDRLLLNDGAGHFVDVTQPLPPLPSAAVVLGDVDDDGDLDAALARGWVLPGVLLHLNDGTGFFTDATAQVQSLPNDSVLGLDRGDVDGDGDLDLVLASNVSFNFGSVEVVLSNDGGVFTETQRVASLTARDMDVVLGDVDGDQDPDAVVARLGGTKALLDNGAGGTFTAVPGAFPGGPFDISSAAALVDVDADSDLDAVFAGGDAGTWRPNALFLNQGAGDFIDASEQLTPLSLPTTSVAVGDVDADGDLDLLFGNGGFATLNTLLLNDGSGSFSDASDQLPQDAESTCAVALADVDGDGDLDGWVGNSTGSGALGNRLYLNDGAGLFTDATALLPASADDTLDVALADLDGDRDLDVFLARRVHEGLFQNLTRQLAWRNVPRVGKPLTLDVYGPPGEPFKLFASLARPDPHGRALLVWTGSLDSGGRAAVTVQVPQQPALVGKTIFWRALVGGSPAPTNLERTTLTGL